MPTPKATALVPARDMRGVFRGRAAYDAYNASHRSKLLEEVQEAANDAPEESRELTQEERLSAREDPLPSAPDGRITAEGRPLP